MSREVAEAIREVARGTDISPNQLSDLILTANDSGTTAGELLKAGARK